MSKKITLSTLLIASVCTPLWASTTASDAQISLDQATSIASQHIVGVIIETELEEENGVLVWEIGIRNTSNDEVEILIDAMSGDILESDEDESYSDDHDSDDEHDHDGNEELDDDEDEDEIDDDDDDDDDEDEDEDDDNSEADSKKQ